MLYKAEKRALIGIKPEELSDFFDQALAEFVPDGGPKSYVVNVLVRYVNASTRLSPEAQTDAEFMSFRPLGEGGQAYGMRRMQAISGKDIVKSAAELKSIGDLMLYMCGFFPDAINSHHERKGQSSVKEYLELGSGAYYDAASLAETRKSLRSLIPANVFYQLSEEFEEFTNALRLTRANLSNDMNSQLEAIALRAMNLSLPRA